MAGPELLLIAGAASAGASVVQGVQANRQARSQASAVRAAGRAERERLEISNRRRLGTARARIGASGVDFSGSPLDVLVDEATTAALGEANVTFNARSRANAIRQQGRNALVGGFARAGTTALTAGIGFNQAGGNFGSLFGGGAFTSNPVFTGTGLEGTLFA